MGATGASRRLAEGTRTSEVARQFYLPAAGNYSLELTIADGGGGHSVTQTIPFSASSAAGVEAEHVLMPGLRIDGPVPNPAVAVVRWLVLMQEDRTVDMDVVDVGGREVTSWLGRSLRGGTTAILWDGRASDRRRVPSGRYYLVVRAGMEVLGRKGTTILR